MLTNNSREIIRSKIARAEKPINKYNVALLRSTEEYMGTLASDERSGEDTGNYPTKHNFD